MNVKLGVQRLTEAHARAEITEQEMREQLARLPEAYLPGWLSEFSLAEVLGIPVPEIRHQSARMLYRAEVVLAARREAAELRKAKGTQ